LQQATKHFLVRVRIGLFSQVKRRCQVAPSEKFSAPSVRGGTLDRQVSQLQHALEPSMHSIPSAELDHTRRSVNFIGDHEDLLIV